MNRNEQDYPPGPEGHPLWGTVRAFQGDLLQMMVDWMASYGDAIRFRYLPRSHGYLLCHPDHYRHILVENRKNYPKNPNPLYDMLSAVGGRGLLTSDGDLWLRQRRLMQPAFHRQQVAQFDSMMTEATRRMLARWAGVADAGKPLNIAREMVQLTLEVSGKSLFSYDLTRDREQVGEAFAEITGAFRKLASHPLGMFIGRHLLSVPFLPRTRRFRRHSRRLNQVVDRIIAERRAARRRREGRSEDVLDMLIDAQDEETGARMSDRQLRAEVLVLLLTSHETVAVALTSVLYRLAIHPTARRKVEQEVDRVLGDGIPTTKVIKELRYTTMVIQEVLRLYPPVYALARTAREADQVGRYRVDANAIVTLSPYLTHRHPDFWREPDRFDPERFTPAREKGRARYAYVPFGGGPRKCIGGAFAMDELVLVSAMISRRYRLEPLPDHPLDLQPSITLHPRDGLVMSVVAR